MPNQEFLSDSDMRNVSFRMNPKLYTKLKIHCFDERITMKKFFEKIVADFFEKNPLPKIR